MSGFEYSIERVALRRRSILAVSFLDLGSHLFQALASVHHLHHVNRDAYADASAKAHSIEDNIIGSCAVLDIEGCMARGVCGAAATVTSGI